MGRLNYTAYSSKSMKSRLSWVQRVLGIPVTCKRDKVTVKALMKFQEDHGLSGNGVVCKQTFDLLYQNGGSKVDINERI